MFLEREKECLAFKSFYSLVVEEAHELTEDPVLPRQRLERQHLGNHKGEIDDTITSLNHQLLYNNLFFTSKHSIWVGSINEFMMEL